MLVFQERGKPEHPEKKLSEKMREPEPNKSHMRWRRWVLNLDHTDGRGVLSPMRHPCSTYRTVQDPIQDLHINSGCESVSYQCFIIDWLVHGLIVSCHSYLLIMFFDHLLKPGFEFIQWRSDAFAVALNSFTVHHQLRYRLQSKCPN